MDQRHTISSITDKLKNGTTYNNLGISISVNIINHQYNANNLAELTQDIMNMLFAARTAAKRVIFFVGDYQNKTTDQPPYKEPDIEKQKNMRKYLTETLSRGGARVAGGTHDIPWALATCLNREGQFETCLRNNTRAATKIVRFWHEALDLWARALPDYNNMPFMPPGWQRWATPEGPWEGIAVHIKPPQAHKQMEHIPPIIELPDTYTGAQLRSLILNYVKSHEEHKNNMTYAMSLYSENENGHDVPLQLNQTLSEQRRAHSLIKIRMKLVEILNFRGGGWAKNSNNN